MLGAGDQHAVNAQSIETVPRDLGRMRSHHGPGLRMVVDMSDVLSTLSSQSDQAESEEERRAAYMSIDGGQSGNVLSRHYHDQTHMFRPDDGSVCRLWHMPFGARADNVRQSAGTLLLRPQQGDAATVSDEL